MHFGAADPAFLRDYGGAVDLVAREYCGDARGLPPFRVFNAYLGHSAASGFAPFAAWEAVVRWRAGAAPVMEGIQLLPLTFGSLYRADAGAAAERTAGLDKAAGGRPRVWGDLFAADLAPADPAGALRRLDAGMSREDSTSRGMVRYYVEMLAAFGAPQPDVVADAPYGMAFGSRDDPKLVVVNPTADRQTVTFHAGGDTVATVPVDPGQALTRGR